MNARQMGSLWIVAIACVGVIIWTHAQHTRAIIGALGSPLAPVDGSPVPVASPMTEMLSTNSAQPIAGDKQGWLATAGNAIMGDVQPQGPDVAWRDVWNNLSLNQGGN